MLPYKLMLLSVRGKMAVQITTQGFLEIYGLLGYYTASCGNCLPMFPFLLGLLTREDGTDTLSRNVGKQLPHAAV
jgi:hypothetical protein